MARKRSNQDEPKAGAPEWMTTYGDMVTLLLCFFVLLFSFSSIDAQKFQSIMQSFQGSLGILDGGTALVTDQFITEAMKDDLTTDQKQELEDFRKLEEALEQYIENYNLESEILVTNENAGLVLRFSDNVLFDSGKAEVKPRSKEILIGIADFLQKPEFINKLIRIEGHTDTDKIVGNFKYPTNWELSVGRASNVVRYLIEEVSLDPVRFSASGYGEYHPVAPNDNVENKSKNRRVDIVILRSEYKVNMP